ncbi:MAG TPA: type II toxin-antitoxin system RelE/ParE family toxin [Saprospiraceae bacterium]|nr:type II toxin-antitoxin system RelE/ParE family toxin [Saprospiraceae bacterium]
MIVSFANTETEKIWDGERSKILPKEIQQMARRKLRMINNAENINDLRIPPANHLKKLKGELSKFYSIRINDQWRIIFNWVSNNAENVEIIDYHE